MVVFSVIYHVVCQNLHNTFLRIFHVITRSGKDSLLRLVHENKSLLSDAQDIVISLEDVTSVTSLFLMLQSQEKVFCVALHCTALYTYITPIMTNLTTHLTAVLTLLTKTLVLFYSYYII